MTPRTGQQIVTDIIGLIAETEVAGAIGGRIYRAGTRPRDSKAEDLVVVYTTADADQIQAGVVTLNLFVPDLELSNNGVMVVDSERCEELEGVMQRSVDALTVAVSNYKFKLRETVHTQHDDETNQAFVVARTGFRYYD